MSYLAPHTPPGLSDLTQNQVMGVQISAAFSVVGAVRALLITGELVNQDIESLLAVYDRYGDELKSRRVDPDTYATI